MKKTALFLFFFTISLGVFSQNTEQKALDYLNTNKDSLLINYTKDTLLFSSSKNKVWYEPVVITSDASKKKVKLSGATSANVEEFYKEQHDLKDIHITTYMAVKDGENYSVKFSIMTNIGIKTVYVVKLDRNELPYQLIRMKK